jgi:type I restriction enzyme, S subunit
MKPYPKYKNSGVEWIGAIPIDWTTIQIKRLSPVKRGASPRPIADPKYFDDNGEYAWIRIADVSASNRYLENTTQQLSEIGSSLSVKQFPGDLFLSIAGTVGKPIITKIKCCIHDGFVYFPNLKVNPEYLYYIFSTGEPYKGLGKWGTQLNLNTETVGYSNGFYSSLFFFIPGYAFCGHGFGKVLRIRPPSPQQAAKAGCFRKI